MQYLKLLKDGDAVLVTKIGSVVAGSLVSKEDVPTIKLKTDMDLVTARKEASKKSKKGKVIHINVKQSGEDAGECELSTEADETTYNTFKNGNEIAPPVHADPKVQPVERRKGKIQSATESTKENKSITKTQNKMATATKKTATKKSAKKAATSTGKETKKELAIKQIVALVNKGSKVFNENHKPLPLGYLSRMTDQARIITCFIQE